LIGVVVVVRREPKPFTEDHIALVQTFADQAAIALTNARLLDAVERQRTELSRFVAPQVAELISSEDGERLLAGHRAYISSLLGELDTAHGARGDSERQASTSPRRCRRRGSAAHRRQLGLAWVSPPLGSLTRLVRTGPGKSCRPGGPALDTLRLAPDRIRVASRQWRSRVAAWLRSCAHIEPASQRPFVNSYSARLGSPAKPRPGDQFVGVSRSVLATRSNSDGSGMRIFAYDRFKPGVTLETIEPYLPEEVANVWRLWKAGIVRENYARADEPGVAIVFELDSVEDAKRYTDDFPLTKAGFLEWFFLPLMVPLPVESLFRSEVDVSEPYDRTTTVAQ
jgi:GAF domain